jgi:hypothetical protein
MLRDMSTHCAKLTLRIALPHFSLLEEARSTGNRRSDWTPETKLRYTKVNFVAGGLHNPTHEDNGIQEHVSNPGAQEEMERLSRLSANATAFVPQPSTQSILQKTEPAKDDTLFVVDTQGQKPTVRQRTAPVVRSPSPIASGSSDEEVVFAGRRPQAIRRVVEDPVLVNASIPTAQFNRRLVEKPIVNNVPKRRVPPSRKVVPPLVNAPEPTVYPIRAAATAQSSRPSWPPSNAVASQKSVTQFSDVLATNVKASWDDTSVEWVHRSKPGIGWSLPRAKPKIASDPVRRGYALKDEPEVDEEEAIMRDYIENMKSEYASSHNAGFLQHRELDVHMNHNSVDLKMRSTMIEATGLEDEDTSEDEDGNRVNNPKGKDRIPVELDSESAFDEDDDEEEDDDSILDNADLEQRIQDDIDDETLARLLAKQETLGIDAEELVLLDDEAINLVNIRKEAALYARNSAKKARRSEISFPSASLMADVLEQDPYGGFDIMDFNRPSLRSKNRGKKARLSIELSDSDLQETLESSWQNDREKKRKRKAEREILRMQGLLTKKGKGRANLSNVYQEGLNVGDLEEVFRNFLESAHQEQALPPMDKLRRKMVHELASVFNMTSKSKGTKQNRFPMIIKTSRTTEWNASLFYSRTKQMNSGFFPRLDAQSRSKTAGSRAFRRTPGGGGIAPGTKYRDGDVVGAAAPELGAENRGRAMLEKMGWAAGTGLGAVENKGILQPIAHVVKNSRAGLG